VVQVRCGPSGAPPLAALDVLGPVSPAHLQVAAASCRPMMAPPLAALNALGLDAARFIGK